MQNILLNPLGTSQEASMGVEENIDQNSSTMKIYIIGVVFAVIFVLFETFSQRALERIKTILTHRAQIGEDVVKYEAMHMIVTKGIPTFKKYVKSSCTIYSSILLHQMDFGIFGVLAMAGLTEHSADFIYMFFGDTFDTIVDVWSKQLRHEEARLKAIVEEDARIDQWAAKSILQEDKEKENDVVQKQKLPQIKISDAEDKMIFAVIGCAQPEHFMDVYAPFLDEFCAKALETWSSEKTDFAKMKIYEMTHECFQEMEEQKAKDLKEEEKEKKGKVPNEEVHVPEKEDEKLEHQDIEQDEHSGELIDILVRQEVLEAPSDKKEVSPGAGIQEKLEQCNKASDKQKEKQKTWLKTPEADQSK